MLNTKINTITAAEAEIGEWRDLYSLALFETDRRELPSRIAEAEHALRIRAKELFSAPSDSREEAQAVDDALYALQALRNCLEFRTLELEVA